MGPFDALNHLINFFVPALGMGLIAPALAKLVWRNALRAVRWIDLAKWVAAACSAVTVAGLVITGQDGRMSTYTAMVVASALALWWRGLRRGRAG